MITRAAPAPDKDFPGIGFVWACTCKAQTPCTRDDQKIGAVFQCPKCEVVFGHVRASNGKQGWVTIPNRQVGFFGFLEPATEEE